MLRLSSCVSAWALSCAESRVLELARVMEEQSVPKLKGAIEKAQQYGLDVVKVHGLLISVDPVL